MEEIAADHRIVYPLDTIYFYLTSSCNLACRHCWIEPSYQPGGDAFPGISLELFQSIVRQAEPLGLKSAKLTGGEPLLHPQIYKIIDFIHDEKLGLMLETNGILCTPQLAQALCSENGALVSVSLDGADAKTHEWIRGVPGCFEGALKGLSNLVNAGASPRIIMTLMRKNIDQIEEMVRLAERVGAGSLKFNLVQPTARGEAMFWRGETLSISEIINIGNRVINDLSGSTKIKIFFDLPLAFQSLSSMLGERGCGCTTCKILAILGVLADGSYSLCGIGETMPEMIFGHAAHDSLAEVWEHSPVLNSLRRGMPNRLEGACGNCIMKDLCLGCCIAQNYYTDKNLWAPFWFCEEAKKTGRFPENRMIDKIKE